MYSSPGSLMGKLGLIWQASEAVIPKIEDRRGKDLKKWQAKPNSRAAVPDTPLSTKNVSTQQKKTSRNRYESILLESYLGVQELQQEIQNTFMCQGASSKKKLSINDLFNPENLENQYYLDNVVPLFFALQLHCVQLMDYVNAEKHVTADAKTVAENARKGGNIRSDSNYGRNELKQDVIQRLKKLEDNSFRSLAALFEPPEKPLVDALEEYQEGLGSPRVKGGQPLTYGEGFDAESLKRLIPGWAKTDPELKRQLERVCRSYQNNS